MRRIIVFLIALFLPVTGALAASGPRTSAQQSGATSRLSDAEIEQKLHTKLAKSKIGKDGFVPKVHNGVVTWEGHTSVPQHKGAATRMAKSSGAVRVVNNIQISDGAKPGQPLRHAQVKPGQSEGD